MHLTRKNKSRIVKSFLIMVLLGLCTGLYGFYQGHDHAFNNTRESPWGLLISSYAFFAITSTGLCITGTVGHVMKNKSITKHGNKILWGSVISMLGAFSIIGMELESPWRMLLYNIISPGLGSNIWFMGTLYGLALGFMIFELWLIYKKKYKTALGIGVAGLIAEVCANTNLGAVFATMSSTPMWFGSALPIFFLICAVLCGLSVISIMMYYNGKDTSDMTMVAKLMLVFLGLITLATSWKFLVIASGGSTLLSMSAGVLLNGQLSIPFWLGEIFMGIILPIVMISTYLKSKIPETMLIGSSFLMLGQFVGKYNLVVSGKAINPMTLSYIPYIPSVTEWMIIVMAIGIIGYLWMAGVEVLEKNF